MNARALQTDVVLTFYERTEEQLRFFSPGDFMNYDMHESDTSGFLTKLEASKTLQSKAEHTIVTPDLRGKQSAAIEKRVTTWATRKGASITEELHHARESSGVFTYGLPGSRNKSYVLDGMPVLSDIWVRTIEVLITSGAVVGLFGTMRHALLQWLKNLGTREIRLKHGGNSITIKGDDDYDKALEILLQLQRRSQEPPAKKVRSSLSGHSPAKKTVTSTASQTTRGRAKVPKRKSSQRSTG